VSTTLTLVFGLFFCLWYVVPFEKQSFYSYEFCFGPINRFPHLYVGWFKQLMSWLMSAEAIATGGCSEAGRRIFKSVIVFSRFWRAAMVVAVPLSMVVAPVPIVERSALAPGTMKVNMGKN